MSALPRLLTQMIDQHPQAFARPFSPAGSRVEVSGWFKADGLDGHDDLHKVLVVRINGKPGLLHVKLQPAPFAELAAEMFDVHTRLARQLHAVRADRGLPIVSAVAQLTGPPHVVARFGQLQTSPEGAPFSGLHFQIDPIFCRSVNQLSSRGAGLWGAFAPLARDADPDRLWRQLIAMSAVITDPARLRLTFDLMGHLADLDPERRHLRETVEAFARHLPALLAAPSRAIGLGRSRLWCC